MAASDANQATPQLHIAFDNSYARDLDGLYVPWQPTASPSPELLCLNDPLAEELGLNCSELNSGAGLAMLAGNAMPTGAQPLAQAYAGHQFGGFSPQLGDGRALLLGEIIDLNGLRRDIALKGSGRTPFSRGGDGKAALGPVLREYLMGEAMHALGIPTTRALAAVATGEIVHRDRPLPGAILTRVAASHLRVGTFEFFAARDDLQRLRRLADYAIARHFPELSSVPDRYFLLLEGVVERQAALIARWMGVGFIHGVMNTDNITISGETIDYGPCAFMEHYDPSAVFSSIDTSGRYAYGNQPTVGQWNLTRFAESLLPLVDANSEKAEERVVEILRSFATRFDQHWRTVLRAKLGLESVENAGRELGENFLKLLQTHRVDFTLAFRRLADVAEGNSAPLAALFGDAEPALQTWLSAWRVHTQAMDPVKQAASIRRNNPIYIPRNHNVEAALTAAEQNDLEPFKRLLRVLRQPFDVREEEAFARPALAEMTANYRTFCGT